MQYPYHSNARTPERGTRRPGRAPRTVRVNYLAAGIVLVMTLRSAGDTYVGERGTVGALRAMDIYVSRYAVRRTSASSASGPTSGAGACERTTSSST